METTAVTKSASQVAERIKQATKDLELMGQYQTFNDLLNSPPSPKWIKLHPTIKVKDDNNNSVPLPYLSISTVEDMLRAIFPATKIEIISSGSLFQSVFVHVRVHYLHPGTNEWMFQDGVGACPIQTDKDASAADLSKIKSGAVMMALPAAESYAIKDACEKLGNIFGANLSRRDHIQLPTIFEGAKIESKEPEQLPEEVIKKIEACENGAEINWLYDAYPALKSNPLFTDALKNKKLSLNGK